MPSYWFMWANEVALSNATLSNSQIYKYQTRVFCMPLNLCISQCKLCQAKARPSWSITIHVPAACHGRDPHWPKLKTKWSSSHFAIFRYFGFLGLYFLLVWLLGPLFSFILTFWAFISFSFWSFGLSFRFILVFWAFISLDFGLLGLYFLLFCVLPPQVAKNGPWPRIF